MCFKRLILILLLLKSSFIIYSQENTTIQESPVQENAIQDSNRARDTQPKNFTAIIISSLSAGAVISITGILFGMEANKLLLESAVTYEKYKSANDVATKKKHIGEYNSQRQEYDNAVLISNILIATGSMGLIAGSVLSVIQLNTDDFDYQTKTKTKTEVGYLSIPIMSNARLFPMPYGIGIQIQ